MALNINKCIKCGNPPTAYYIISIMNPIERFQIECECSDYVVIEESKNLAITIWNGINNENKTKET